MIADYLPVFDLIISGHAHRISPRRRTNQLNGHQTPLIAPGTAGRRIEYGAGKFRRTIRTLENH